MSEESSAFWEDLAEDLKNDPGFARDYSRESTNIQAVDRGIMSMEDWKLVPQPESEDVSGIALIHTLCGEGPTVYTPKDWTAEAVYQWIGFHLCDRVPVTPEMVIGMNRIMRTPTDVGCQGVLAVTSTGHKEYRCPPERESRCTDCVLNTPRVEVGYD